MSHDLEFTTLDEAFEQISNDPEASIAERECDFRMELGDCLNELRNRKGWTYEEFAQEMGTSRSQIQRLINADSTKSPSLRTVFRALSALDKEMDLIIHSDDRSTVTLDEDWSDAGGEISEFSSAFEQRDGGSRLVEAA
jgi:transcriptional regulator with XRE-family HTH domain